MRAAGTLSKVLIEARRAARHAGGIVTAGASRPRTVEGRGLSLTNWQLRRALEQGALEPTTASYSPTAGDAPVPEAALGVVGTPTRTKSAETCRAMTENVRARHLYRDRVAALSAGTTRDPYLYC